MAKLDFNVSDVQVSDNYQLLPAGWYQAHATKTEMRSTKNGGSSLNVQFTIRGPSHRGRVVFARFNLQNANETAVKIAREQLATLARSAGCPAMRDTDELINRPIEIKIVVKPEEGQYEASNDVKAYRPVTGGAGGFVAPASASAPSTAPGIPDGFGDDEIPF